MIYEDRPFAEKPVTDRAGIVVGTALGLALTLPFWYFTLIQIPMEIVRTVSG